MSWTKRNTVEFGSSEALKNRTNSITIHTFGKPHTPNFTTWSSLRTKRPSQSKLSGNDTPNFKTWQGRKYDESNIHIQDRWRDDFLPLLFVITVSRVGIERASITITSTNRITQKKIKAKQNQIQKQTFEKVTFQTSQHVQEEVMKNWTGSKIFGKRKDIKLHNRQGNEESNATTYLPASTILSLSLSLSLCLSLSLSLSFFEVSLSLCLSLSLSFFFLSLCLSLSLSVSLFLSLSLSVCLCLSLSLSLSFFLLWWWWWW